MSFLFEPSLPVAAIEILVGLVLLAFAADKFVDGAVGVAKAARISPVVVGAVIVGFGTSAPELLVSGIAAVDGNLDLGVGNVVGSNVANLSLVLAAAAFIVPIVATRAVLSKEVPLSLAATMLFAYFTVGGLEVWEGVVMLAVLVAMLTWTIVGGRVEPSQLVELEVDSGAPSLAASSLITVVGLAGTILGAQALVTGATSVADEVGLTGGFVGFTLVALGTSLPELVTGVVAARKGQTELILGNLLGSNVFNSLAVGGVIAVLGAGRIESDSLRTIGVLAMLVVGVTASLFMLTRRRLHRPEAAVLLAIWLISIALLARDAQTEEPSDRAVESAEFSVC